MAKPTNEELRRIREIRNELLEMAQEKLYKAMTPAHVLEKTRPWWESYNKALSVYDGQEVPIEALALLLQRIVDGMLASIYELTPIDPPLPHSSHGIN